MAANSRTHLFTIYHILDSPVVINNREPVNMFVYPTFRLTVNILNNDYWLDDTCIAHDIFQAGVYGLFEYLK